MNPYEVALIRIADLECERIAEVAIRSLQGERSKLFGDETPLRDAWDEICVQVQFDESLYWDVYQKTAIGFIETAVKKLEPVYLAAIWLNTESGTYWVNYQEECKAPSFDEPPANCDEVAEYIFHEHLLKRAGSYSNERIRAYIDSR